MERPSPSVFFRQTLKSDSFAADEIINIFLLRPLAAAVVWVLYPTRVTPNQVTVASVVAGFAAALVYLAGSPAAIAAAGLLVTLKDILDDADGQLARAKEQYSRRGRFLDSIGDFLVNIVLFSSITVVVYRMDPGPMTVLLGVLSCAGITLRVSWHVFYQVSFLHLEDRYKLNRIVEEVTEEDRKGDRFTLVLQIIFNVIYTWQDRLMYRIDEWCRGAGFPEEGIRKWYADKTGLRLSGLLGFGTEFALLTVCSLFGALKLYLLLNVLAMNGIWLAGILYRRIVLSRRVVHSPAVRSRG